MSQENLSNTKLELSNSPQTSNLPALLDPHSSRSLVYHIYTGTDINEALLERCAELFSKNYGIWGQQPASTSTRVPKTGTRVKMSSRMLREKIMSTPDRTVLAACFSSTSEKGVFELVGQVFATVWDYDTGKVGWVTQLVVDLGLRRKYIATQLIQMLKLHPLFDGVTAVGLVSTHPAACDALSKYVYRKIHSIDLSFCQRHAKSIVQSSPVSYIRTMELSGSLFQENATSSIVCCAFTNFYVDHGEPLQALSTYKSAGAWPLGELPEGHEFLVIHLVPQNS